MALFLAASGLGPARAADAITPGEFVVERPTLICLGFQWFVEGDDNRNATVKVEYRAKGPGTWKQGLPLLRSKGEKVGWGKGHGGLTRALAGLGFPCLRCLDGGAGGRIPGFTVPVRVFALGAAGPVDMQAVPAGSGPMIEEGRAA